MLKITSAASEALALGLSAGAALAAVEKVNSVAEADAVSTFVAARRGFYGGAVASVAMQAWGTEPRYGSGASDFAASIAVAPMFVVIGSFVEHMVQIFPYAEVTKQALRSVVLGVPLFLLTREVLTRHEAAPAAARGPLATPPSYEEAVAGGDRLVGRGLAFTS